MVKWKVSEVFSVLVCGCNLDYYLRVVSGCQQTRKCLIPYIVVVDKALLDESSLSIACSRVCFCHLSGSCVHNAWHVLLSLFVSEYEFLVQLYAHKVRLVRKFASPQLSKNTK